MLELILAVFAAYCAARNSGVTAEEASTLFDPLVFDDLEKEYREVYGYNLTD